MTAPATTTTVTLAPPAVPPVSPERQVSDFTARMIQEYGTIENALRGVSTRMFAAEDKLQASERTVTELRGKVPADGSVVLPKAEAENFAKLKALGTVDEIVAGMKERGELKGETERTKREKAAREAATAAGLDADAFAAYALRENLPIEMRDVAVTEKGKVTTKKMPFVRTPGDDKAPFVALGEYTSKLLAFDQRALMATPTQQQTGTPYLQQAPSSPVGGGGGSILDSYIAKRNAPKQQPAAPAS